MTLTITLRNLDERTEAWLKEEAARTNESVEAVARRLLQLGVDVEQNKEAPQSYHDLDWMLGQWSEEEAAAFEAAIVDFEQIDEQLWQ